MEPPPKPALEPYEPPVILWEEAFIPLAMVSNPDICAQPNPPPQCD